MCIYLFPRGNTWRQAKVKEAGMTDFKLQVQRKLRKRCINAACNNDVTWATVNGSK